MAINFISKNYSIIPVVSTIAAISQLSGKIVLATAKVFGATTDSFGKFAPVFKKLEEQSLLKIVMMAVPVLGNIGCYFLFNEPTVSTSLSTKSQKDTSPSKSDASLGSEEGSAQRSRSGSDSSSSASRSRSGSEASTLLDEEQDTERKSLREIYQENIRFFLDYPDTLTLEIFSIFKTIKKTDLDLTTSTPEQITAYLCDVLEFLDKKSDDFIVRRYSIIFLYLDSQIRTIAEKYYLEHFVKFLVEAQQRKEASFRQSYQEPLEFFIEHPKRLTHRVFKTIKQIKSTDLVLKKSSPDQIQSYLHILLAFLNDRTYEYLNKHFSSKISDLNFLGTECRQIFNHQKLLSQSLILHPSFAIEVEQNIAWTKVNERGLKKEEVELRALLSDFINTRSFDVSLHLDFLDKQESIYHLKLFKLLNKNPEYASKNLKQILQLISFYPLIAQGMVIPALKRQFKHVIVPGYNTLKSNAIIPAYETTLAKVKEHKGPLSAIGLIVGSKMAYPYAAFLASKGFSFAHYLAVQNPDKTLIALFALKILKDEMTPEKRAFLQAFAKTMFQKAKTGSYALIESSRNSMRTAIQAIQNNATLITGAIAFAYQSHQAYTRPAPETNYLSSGLILASSIIFNRIMIDSFAKATTTSLAKRTSSRRYATQTCQRLGETRFDGALSKKVGLMAISALSILGLLALFVNFMSKVKPASHGAPSLNYFNSTDQCLYM